MSKYVLILLLTSLLSGTFFLRLNGLLKKRTHANYLIIISISAFRTTLIIAFYILTIAFLFGAFGDILYDGHSFESNSIMEKIAGVGLLVLVSSWIIPFFFIQQIEFSGGKVTIDNESVSWSLKKYSTQTERTCYIQFHIKNKERIYLITNLNILNNILRTTINPISLEYIPSLHRENELIGILESRKKKSEFRFLSKSLIVSIVIVISTMILTILIK